MNELQQRLYGLLKEVDGICKRNDITYYLAGGAALGAIRGGGFLPWDDDIDLYITRKNWDRLVEVMEKEELEDRLFVCCENDELYCNPVGRYVDTTTTLMMKSQLVSAKACGVMVEFFIFDAMPLGEKEKWEHRRCVKTYCELLSPYFVCNKNALTDNVDFDYDMYNEYLERCEGEGREKVLDELLSKITCTDEEDSDYWCMFWGRRTLMYPKEFFGEPRMEKFEDDLFPIPAGQEGVSRVAFGDSWMYVPGASGQIIHGINGDITVPFGEVVDIYMPHIDRDEVLKSFERNKRTRVDALQYQDNYNRELASARLSMAAQRLNGTEEDAETIRKMLEEGDMDEAGKTLREFFFYQGRGDVKINKLLADVCDEYLAVAIEYLIVSGRYYSAGSIIAVRKAQDRPLRHDLEKIIRKHSILRELSIAIYDEMDVEKAEGILEEHPELADIPDFARARLWIMREIADEVEDWEHLLEKAKEFGERHPWDGEIMAYEAYALHHLGRTSVAEAVYLKAIENTRNGFVWRDAAELTGIDPYRIVDGDDVKRTVGSEDDGVDMDIGDTGNHSGSDDEDPTALPDAGYHRDKLVELLYEVDEICRENGLVYSLTGLDCDSMIRAGRLPDDIGLLRIAMTGGDIDRLIAIVNDPVTGPKDRVIEHFGNNPHARGMGIRYVATDTTLIDIKEYGNHTYYGLHLRIEPVNRIVDKKTESRIKRFRSVWKGGQKRLESATKTKYYQSIMIKAMMKVVGRDRIAERYMDLYRESYHIDRWGDIQDIPKVKCGKVVWNNGIRTNAFNVNKKQYIKTWDIIDINDGQHDIMVCNQFFDLPVGKRPKQEKMAETELMDSRPISETMTDDVVRHLDNIQKTRDRYISITDPVQPDVLKIDRAWKYYRMAMDIVLLRREYDDATIEKMLDRARNMDKDGFLIIANDYLKKAEYWNHRSDGFCHTDRIRNAIIEGLDTLYPSNIDEKEITTLKKNL